MDENNNDAFITIAGQSVKVRYDVQAQMDIEQTLELMKGGVIRKEFIDLTSPNYDTRDMVVMLMHGFNGANRAEGIDKRLGYPEAQAIYESNLNFIGKNAKDISEVRAELAKLKIEISKAAQKGMNLFI